LGGFALIQSARIRPIRVIRVPFQLAERFAVSQRLLEKGKADAETRRRSGSQRDAKLAPLRILLIFSAFLCISAPLRQNR